MRLVPREEVLAKLAAIQSADALGRRFAQDQAVEKLASMAGVFMAHARSEEGMDKLAQAMVQAGELSQAEYEMLKEAGLLGSLVKGVSGLGRGAARMGRAAVTKTRGAIQNIGSQVRATKSVNQAMQAAKAAPSAGPTAGSGVLRRRAGKVTPVKPAAKVYSGEGSGMAQAAAPKVEPVMRRGKPVGPSQAAPQAAGGGGGQSYSWEAQGGAPGRVKPAPVASASPTGPVGPGAQTGKAGTVPPASQQAAKQAPPAQQAAKQAPPTQQAPAPEQSGGKGMTWGKAAPWLALGGLGYGLYKGVPWAARQLESASSTPMAYGGGWSPVPYGYGSTPYGEGMPTMGYGT